MKATKMFALMAVLAMAFAGVAVMAEQNDAANEPAVVCFAEGKDAAATAYNKMMVFGYADTSIIINTTYMDLGKATEFIVTIADNATYASATNKTTVGPLSAQNGKLVIDAGTAIFAANATLYINLYDYESSATALSTATLTVPAKVEDAFPAIAFDLYTNYLKDFKDANGFDVAHTNTVASGETGYEATYAEKPVTVAAASVVRNVDITLDKTTGSNAFTDTNGVYELKGWSIGYTETAKIDLYPGSYTIEEVIMTLADAHMLDEATETAPQYTPIPTEDVAAASNLGVDQVAGKLILNAIWEKKTYEVILADGLDASNYPAEGFGITDVAFPAIGSLVKASVTSKIDADSFGTIRIQQTTLDQYNYTFTVYKFKELDSKGEKTYEEDTTPTNVKIKMITNGVFKLSEVKSDLVIKITPTAVASTDPVQNTAYAFNVDTIKNTDDVGYVQLSLDLFDYVPVAGTNHTDKITISGTYYKDLGDGVRAYGNLVNSGELVKTNNVKCYIDNAAEDTPDTSVVTGEAAMLLNGNDSTFDLVWTGTTVGIYAAQGVWGQYADDESDTEAVPVYTPWALFTA